MTSKKTAYQLGRESFLKDEDQDANPFPFGHKLRSSWFSGYLDVRTDTLFGDAFQRHGLSSMTQERLTENVE